MSISEGQGWSYIKESLKRRGEPGGRSPYVQKGLLSAAAFTFFCDLPPSQSVSASLVWGLSVLKGHPSGLSEVGVLQVRQEFGRGESVGGTCGGTEAASPGVSQHLLRPFPPGSPHRHKRVTHKQPADTHSTAGTSHNSISAQTHTKKTVVWNTVAEAEHIENRHSTLTKTAEALRCLIL